jgi:hypothetical protein
MMQRTGILAILLLSSYDWSTEVLRTTLPAPIFLDIFSNRTSDKYKTFNGAISSHGAVTGDDSSTGTVIDKQVNGSFVADADCFTNWGAADLGSCINAIYRAGPASGVDILVSPTPNANNNCTNYAIPILLNTNHKPAYLHGPPGQIVCLKYTPSTGAAITLDWGETSGSNPSGVGQGYGEGINGIHLNGTSASNSATALALGTINGGEGLHIENFGFQNFGTIITFAAGVDFFQKFEQGTIGPTNNAFNFSASGGIENVEFDHVKFQCSLGASGGGSVCISITNTANLAEFNFIADSFDNSDISINSGACGASCIRATFTNSHFETLSNSTTDFINIQSGTVSIIGSGFLYDPPTGSRPSELITCNRACSLNLGGNYYLGFQSFPVVNVTNGGKFFDTGDVYLAPALAALYTFDGNTSSQVFVADSLGTTPRATAGLDIALTQTGSQGLRIYGDNFSTLKAQLTGNKLSLAEGSNPKTASGFDTCGANSTNHDLECSYNNGTFLHMPQTVASGTAAMTTTAITAGNCGATVTVAATGVLTTDTISWSFNAAPAGSNAGLITWTTAGKVNFAYCPNSAETPAAATINWKVVR